MLLASSVAGWVRESHCAATTFLDGAAFAGVALAL